jgi:hypothetical protein
VREKREGEREREGEKERERERNRVKFCLEVACTKIAVCISSLTSEELFFLLH